VDFRIYLNTCTSYILPVKAVTTAAAHAHIVFLNKQSVIIVFTLQNKWKNDNLFKHMKTAQIKNTWYTF